MVLVKANTSAPIDVLLEFSSALLDTPTEQVTSLSAWKYSVRIMCGPAGQLSLA